MQFSAIDDDLAAQAGRIFSAAYRRRAAVDSALRPALADEDSVSRRISEWAGRGASVAAHVDGTLHGYMVGAFIPSFFRADRSFYVPEWGLHPGGPADRSLLRRMYAWLTRSGQLDGAQMHAVTTFHSDGAAAELFRLGFGAHLFDAVRSCEAIDSQRADSVRAAHDADLDQLAELNRLLYEHLSSPPVYLPAQSPKFTRDRLPGDSAYTAVAEVDGRIVGFISCQLGEQESSSLRDPLVPHINGAYILPAHRGGDLATALLDDLLAWARERSCSRVTTDFETANVEGAGFWLGAGFRPVLVSLVRRIGV